MPQRSQKRSRELPKNARLIKTRLPRPLPPHRLSADPKVVYVSTRSPFVSTVKRVRKALEVFKAQSKVAVASGARQRRAFHRRQQPEASHSTSSSGLLRDDKNKHVTIKATGRAIEKALALGLYFQGQKDTAVEIRTGTVECTDNVVADQTGVTFEDLMKAKERAEASEDDDDDDEQKGDIDAMDVDGEQDEFEEIDDVFPSRTRNTSVVEIVVRNKAPT
ncbi:hypothetical protein DRE_00738 [Drechslerella stenobrocha 248]|uniref:Uncharacterized protein n=1 Tax=Drechslerella stenobrocha 248 TaxID=1043628 RepID=W7HQA3_9PEZI|nr:hypothetical protein DRE_00738 [Drechslerella stenobrocha 248]